MKKETYWCGTCKVPVTGQRCGNCKIKLEQKLRNPLKPVFKKEYSLYLEHIPIELRKTFPKILYRSRNYLIADTSAPDAFYSLRIFGGDETVGENKLELLAVNAKPIRSQYRKDIHPFEDEIYLETLLNANLDYLQMIEEEALDFIKDTINNHSGYEIMSSFSGGKDSTVTAFLVSQVFKNQKIVFSDTGIEYQETIDYIRNYGDFFGELVFLEQKNDFYELCKILDPPSRMMRWCCSTQKATPINNYQQQLKKPSLSFDGIRKEESSLRADYARVKDNTKMIHQISSYPILDWTELEVWLYILWKKIPFNPLYEEGYARIGCYPCPNNGVLDNFLMYYFHEDLANNWYQTIQNFALKMVDDQSDYSSTLKHLIPSFSNELENTGNTDDSTHWYDRRWVNDDKWKGRRVKYENEMVGFISAESENSDEADIEENELDSVEPCKFDNTLVIDLNEKLPTNVDEFLSVFGDTRIKNIKNMKILEVKAKNYTIFNSEKSSRIRLKYDPDLDISKAIRLVVRQLNKSMNCFNCGSCIGSCPLGAISMNPTFTIDSEKCTNCLTCTGTKYLKFSCVALHYKSDRKLIQSNVSK